MTDTADRGGGFIFVETSAMQITSEKGRKSKEEASKSQAGEEVSTGLGQWERPQSIARPGTRCLYAGPLKCPEAQIHLPPRLLKEAEFYNVGKTGRKRHGSCCKELAGAESTASLLLPPPPRCGLLVVVLILQQHPQRCPHHRALLSLQPFPSLALLQII